MPTPHRRSHVWLERLGDKGLGESEREGRARLAPPGLAANSVNDSREVSSGDRGTGTTEASAVDVLSVREDDEESSLIGLSGTLPPWAPESAVLGPPPCVTPTTDA